jgi:hypothetical protein
MAIETGEHDPYPWEGWLEEHPEGGLMFMLEDNSTSPMLRSYDEVEEFLGREGPKAVDVIRIRRAVSLDGLDRNDAVDEVVARAFEGNLYPPDQEGGE